MEQINFQNFRSNLYRSASNLINSNNIENVVLVTSGIACATFLSQLETFDTSSVVIKYASMAIYIIAPIALSLMDIFNSPMHRELPRREIITPPLHLAIAYEDFKGVELLLETGVDIDEYDDCGNTPLHGLFWGLNRKVNIDLAKLLLDNGADVNARERINGNTVLHRAVRWTDDIDLIELLLIRGANIEAVNNDGDSPIKYTLKTENIKITRLLLANAPLTEIPRFNNRFQQIEAIEMLLEAGTNPFMFSTEAYPEIKDKIEMYQQGNKLKNARTNI